MTVSKGPDILLARIARGRSERCEVGTWLAECYCLAMTGHVRTGQLLHCVVDGEPATCARNTAALYARQFGVEILVMVDNDMLPSSTFFRRAVEFFRDHKGSVVYASPYCGAPPAEDVQVFGLGDFARVSREDAAERKGVELVGAVGTGLVAIRMEAFDTVGEPFFAYEYDGPGEYRLASTEDFTFCRRLTELGGRVYCDWDSWSGHAKTCIVGRPEPAIVTEGAPCSTS